MNKILTILITLVLLWITSWMHAPVGYGYQSSDYEFTDSEFPKKGRTLKIVESNFDRYKKESNQQDIILYRTRKRNPLLISEWYDFVTNRRWNYHYREKIKN